MPKNYMSAMIYRIGSKNTEDIYIGSTRAELPQRLAELKAKPPREAALLFRLGDLHIDWICPAFSRTKAELKFNTDRIIADYRRQYNVLNKQTVNTKIIKHTCECGGKYTNQNKARHLLSKKHANYLADAHTPTHTT